MKTLFLPAKAKVNVMPVVDKALSNELKNFKKIGLVTNIQHVHELEKVKERLEAAGKKVEIGGQVLGCDAREAQKISDKVDVFLFIGSGEFHPIEVALESADSMQNAKDIICANPFTMQITIYSKDEVKKTLKRRDALLAKFLMARNIGVLVSNKPGQNFHQAAKIFINKLDRHNKKGYLFFFNELDIIQMKNFKFIDFWINTACTRIVDNNEMLNLNDVLPALNKLKVSA